MKFNNTQTKGETMRELILKGLGKAKVKKIIKEFVLGSMIESFVGYADIEYTVYKGTTAYTVDDVDFTTEELLEFVGNKI